MSAAGELSLSYEQKMKLAEWVVKAGDTALDYLFMTYLPLPFLAGHSLRLALRSLPAPLRDAITKLCREYASELRPPDLPMLDNTERAFGRVVRQLLRVGWAVAGLRVLPALVSQLAAPSSSTSSLRSTSSTSSSTLSRRPPPQGAAQPPPELGLGPGALTAWVATGIMAAGQGVWSGDQLSATLLRYKTEHPATFVPFLFPEHFDAGHRVQDALEGAAEWIGLTRPSSRRREKWLREFVVRLCLHTLTVHGYFAWLCWMAPKNSTAHIWAKCLGVAYFILYLPSFRYE
jgi:hypothetical protein